MLAFISPFMLPLAAAAAGLEYLRRSLLPEAPSTSSVAPPFTPPFEGGQCEGGYYVEVVATYPNGEKIYGYYNGLTFFNRLSESSQRTTTLFTQKIQSFETYVQSNGTGARINGINIVFFGLQNFTQQPTNVSLGRLLRANGQPDNCGNLPNPNPAPPISSDGLAGASPPDLSNDPDLVLGAPLVTIPSVVAPIAAAAAALAAAASTAAGLAALMDAIKAIGDALGKLKEWLEDKDKDEDTKKTLRRHDYGSIRKDGFLRLYPNGEGNGFKPKYIDLQMLSIPISYGRFFGNLSPNFYRFQSLGYIAFVSPTFGVLSVHEIEFSRCSMTVPDNAFGFFYHLGLDDTLRANVSMFYLQNE